MHAHYLLTNRGYCFLDISKLKLGDIEQHQRHYKLFFPILFQRASSLLLFPKEASNIVNHGFIKYFLRCGNLDTIGEVRGFMESYLLRTCRIFNSAPHMKCPDAEELLRYILSIEPRQGASRTEIYNRLKTLEPSFVTLLKNVFSSTYNKQSSVEKLAERLGRSVQTVERLQLVACQVLHLILSIESPYTIDL